MKPTVKLLIASGMMLLSVLKINSQTQSPPANDNTISLGDQVKLKIGGFLKSDIFYDTRKTVDIIDGLFFLLPASESLDANNKDINAVPLLRMSAVSSRLSTKFTGPDVLNAKSSAYVEFDFSGFNSIGLRLRQAYLKLNWENDEILFGRCWHPLFIMDAFPSVLAFNTGAPFVAFNRTEQIRYTHTLGNLSVMLASTMQYDYSFASKFDSTSAVYFSKFYHNSVLPDANITLQYKSDLLLVGATGNYKVNQPLLYTEAHGRKYKTDEKINSIAISGYAQIKTGPLKVKGSAMYGENMREFLMLGGYAIKSKDTATGNEKYSSLNNLFVWANILYGDALQAGIFFGYAKNLGSKDNNLITVSSTFSRGQNIAQLIRISPIVTYKTGRMQFSAEVEHTIAAYGTPDLADHGKVKNTKNIANTRVQFSTFFYF